MGLDFEYSEGQTPIYDDEREGLLIRSITRRGELDEYEQLNIEDAVGWTVSRTFSVEKILSEDVTAQTKTRTHTDDAEKHKIITEKLFYRCCHAARY